MSGTVGPGTRTREDQYTTNKETDFYVSDLAEDALENPFKKDPTTQPISDPDGAALAALLSRKKKPATVDDAEDSELEEQQSDASSPSYIFGDKQSTNANRTPPEEAVESVEPTEASQPANSGRRRSSIKRSQGSLMEKVSGSTGPLDPGTERLSKRARRDEQALIVQPDDNEGEEGAKMRANLIQNGDIIPETDEPTDSEEEAISIAAGDDEIRPKGVAPVPLMDQLSGRDEREEVPKDVGDDYDDVEAKRDDDYDPGDYVRFEDDEDDMEAALSEDGPEFDERLMVDEDELIPEPAENASSARQAI